MSLLERATASLVGLVRETLLSRLTYYGSFEYRVAAQSGNRIDAYPADARYGLPELSRVTLRPSILGESAVWPPGSTLLVAFVNGDPTRPFVLAGDPAGVPLTSVVDATGGVTIGHGDTRPIARLGDAVQAGPYTGVITSGSTLNKAG